MSGGRNDMTKPDDKHDHELAAWLDGSDGVSAAYRQTAHEEPRPALDRAILQAARDAVQPQAASRNTAQSDARANYNLARKPYAFAASVMIAVAGLSFYIGVRDEAALQPGAAIERVIQLEAPAPPQQDAVPAQNPASAQDAPAQDASAAAEVPRLQQAEAERARVNDAQADAERTVASNFEQRQLAPATPTVGAGDAGAAIPPAETPVRRETFARSEEAPALVIDGPFLEQIEADAEAARERASGAQQQLEEIMVTGSRIMRQAGTPAYRASRDEWLAEMRALVAGIERSTRLTVARRNTAILESQLEEEIELFLQVYPDTDIDAELGLQE